MCLVNHLIAGFWELLVFAKHASDPVPNLYSGPIVAGVTPDVNMSTRNDLSEDCDGKVISTYNTDGLLPLCW
jgi:hypothetical protein